ncbi:hypothetical protein [Sphingomonas paeninsulae]|uniref:hypothetical protein n=1 Tax=Sphingomonas paeninsulae TaxID=2319844 RepID=UPI0019690946|nr:hypothetical protein [Sphingomonas paeninsulae]
MGLGSLCPGKPIDVVIPPLKYHIMSVFERKVMVGGNIWNDSAHEVPLALDKDNNRTVPSADRARIVGDDKCGVTFASAGFVDAKTRLVPIAAEKGQPYVMPTLETVRDGSYPLALEVYAYADQLPDQPLDPKPIRIDKGEMFARCPFRVHLTNHHCTGRPCPEARTVIMRGLN